MIKPDQIPDEVVKAALHAYDTSFKNDYTTGEEDIAAAIVAALNAWPKTLWDYKREDGTRLILPLPQESS